MKVHVKLVDNKVNKAKFKTDKVPMDFMLNEFKITTEPLSIADEMIHDKPNISVSSNEIRIKWIAGSLSLVSITITPQPKTNEPGAIREEVAKNT